MTRFHLASIPAGHTPALTGLRGVAAVWVMLYHLWQFAGEVPVMLGPIDLTAIFSCGYLGVDLFFVLSGFLVGGPFVQARIGGTPTPRLAAFWRRRLARVLPAYWVQILILFAVALGNGGPSDLSVSGAIGQALLVFNLYDSGPLLNPVYWSLPVEWDYYILLPLLALGFPSGAGRPWIVAAAVGFSISFRVACWWLFWHWPINGAEVYPWVIGLPGRLDQFVFGMAAAWLHATGRAQRWWRPLQLGGLIVLSLMVWQISPRGDIFGKVDAPWLFWHCTLLGGAFAALVASCAAMPGSAVLCRLLTMPVLLFSGVVSYSLYLWHFPIIQWAKPIVLGSAFPGLAWWIFVPSICIAAATLSYAAVERPFQQLRGRWRKA
jgi:peptidoglycan/LPS O-acetylase OafA/YrhL